MHATGAATASRRGWAAGGGIEGEADGFAGLRRLAFAGHVRPSVVALAATSTSAARLTISR